MGDRDGQGSDDEFDKSIVKRQKVQKDEELSLTPGRREEQPREDEELRSELYEQLVELRDKMASECGYAPDMVFNNRILLALPQACPTTLEQLGKVKGVSEAKLNKFGQRVVDTIASFCAENNLQGKVDDRSEAASSSARDDSSSSLLQRLSKTQRDTYLLYRQCQDLEKVARNRRLKVSTIMGHLAEAIKVGLPVNLEHLGITDLILDVVTGAVAALDGNIEELTTIQNLCYGVAGFSRIKVVLCYLQAKYGIENSRLNLPQSVIDHCLGESDEEVECDRSASGET